MVAGGPASSAATRRTSGMREGGFFAIMGAADSPARMLFRAALPLFLAPLCFAGDSGGAHYAGSQACSLCHKDIAASQTTTAMAKTWHGAVTSLLPPSYHGLAKEGSAKSLEYEVRRQGNHFGY